MKSFLFTLAAFAAGSNALAGRSDNCCFGLTASGSASGTLGQLSDGQNRIGDNNLPPAQYCIDSTGSITDSSGRGCILTPPTTQFQCDEGATPTPGFSVSRSGQLQYQGSPSFITCETGQNGGMNIYITNSSAVTQCKNIQLMADSCLSSGAGAGASSSAVASSTRVSTAAASSTPVVSGPAAGSTPAGSAPAGGSVPASTAPASTAPAGTAPAGACHFSPITVMTTLTVTATSAPAGLAPSGSSPPGAPAPSGSAPAPSGSATSAPVSSTSVPATSGGVSPSSSAGRPSGMTSVPTSSTTSSPPGNCPTTLTTPVGGNFEFPHLIIPLNSASPDTAYGTQFNGIVNSTVSTIFNFDVSSSHSGKTCSLVFLFPHLADLETSYFSFSGDGKIDISQLSSPASNSTTYNNAPSIMKNLGDRTISPGNNYVISTFSCPAGQAVAYEMKNAGTTDLNYFEDYNPAPIGLYITVC